MNLKEFMQALKSMTRKQNVRKYLSQGLGNSCPITAVCKSLTNANYTPCEFDKAAKKIGLSSETANKIVEAADRNLENLVGTEAKIRKQMLDAVGLPIN